jgi:hypothetical protein
LEVQQLRQYRRGNSTAADLPYLQTKMRVSECHLLPARMRLHGNGQSLKAVEISVMKIFYGWKVSGGAARLIRTNKPKNRKLK